MSPQTPPPIETGDEPAQSGAAALDGDMGAALRLIYQAAANEAIPPEMLDLLSKLD
ncbi:hypothetical protein [Sphingomonas sp.]|uniref:hypothetical protein n=1 Tax=Sphingomonas sp. TaxID=28214 RepID=UPI001D548E91|nr:hypothetical protein [Sphingomonas sp.]MBX9797063.1 hypothetical protein [Sphingomonas sp.]